MQFCQNCYTFRLQWNLKHTSKNVVHLKVNDSVWNQEILIENRNLLL
jgi:hypothetical protein